ncbi:FAD-dependent thymidylate synthase [Pueribacillus theae]|uniref:FAD-dependent thymidylate synthase n=1 Tax=Pueribacillus theae TaxID=2171751 RepID=A0A2U1K1P6_9BACI|nr:FAD-dependent thymidylate synthase [Pueribacillus theae]PWA11089.1 FAD-dependent thymidylate synthase [Pueribacillus theae]
MSNKITVLDKGYVRLIEPMGSDLSVVNAARVSFDKESGRIDDRDKRLIQFLAREGHTSPFRHAFASFEIYAPLMVARQWFKYIVGSDHAMDGWNESSRRYITEEPTFYVPGKEEWRSAPENSKQGSGKPVDPLIGNMLMNEMENHIRKGEALYNFAIEQGICAEQARLFLPAYSLYVRWRWTASLQSICHFLNERLASDAQNEITQYAKGVYELVEPHFPESVKALVKQHE